MLQSMRSRRVGHNLATEQQQEQMKKMRPSNTDAPDRTSISRFSIKGLLRNGLDLPLEALRRASYLPPIGGHW